MEKFEITAVRKSLRVLEEFSRHYPNCPIQIAHTFLLVVLNEGKSMRELGDIAGLPQSTMSRHLLDLGPRNRWKEPGLKLVKHRYDPMEMRKKQYTLSPKGRALVKRIVNIINGAG